MGARLPARRDAQAFQSSTHALGWQAVPSWVDQQPVGAEDLTVGELGRSGPAHRALELTLHHRIPTALAFVEHRWPVGAGVGDPGQASHDQSDAGLPPELAAVHATAGAVAVENMHQVTARPAVPGARSWAPQVSWRQRASQANLDRRVAIR